MNQNCDSFPMQRQLTCRSWPLRPRLRRSPRWTTRPRPQTRPPRSGGGSWRPSGTCSHWTPPPRMAAETPRPCPSRRPCTPPGKNVTFEGPRPNVQLGNPMYLSVHRSSDTTYTFASSLRPRRFLRRLARYLGSESWNNISIRGKIQSISISFPQKSVSAN